MAQLFKGLSKLVAERAVVQGSGGLKLSLPVDFSPNAEENEILTPLGPIKAEQFRGWADLNGAELSRAADSFFPWWTEGFNGSFFRGLALNSLWMELRWATPLDDEELTQIKNTLTWCGQALKLGAQLPIPASAITELRELMDPDKSHGLAKGPGIGYRRRMMVKSLPGNWKVTLPGSVEESIEEEDDNQTLVFSTDGLDVRVTVAGGPTTEPQPDIEAGDIYTEHHVIEGGDGIVILSVVARAFPNEGEEEVCLITFTVSDSALRGLVEQLAETVTYDGPDEDDED